MTIIDNEMNQKTVYDQIKLVMSKKHRNEKCTKKTSGKTIEQSRRITKKDTQ